MKLQDRNFESEFKFRTSKSSGAGGQHVNTTETKVGLIFNINNSAILTEEEKVNIFLRLNSYINDEGELRITSSESRSQATNKEGAIKKFYHLLAHALKEKKKRIPTKKPKEIKENILKAKKINSEKKGDRRFRTRDFL